LSAQLLERQFVERGKNHLFLALRKSGLGPQAIPALRGNGYATPEVTQLVVKGGFVGMSVRWHP
jgi:hypothetical protein